MFLLGRLSYWRPETWRQAFQRLLTAVETPQQGDNPYSLFVDYAADEFGNEYIDRVGVHLPNSCWPIINVAMRRLTAEAAANSNGRDLVDLYYPKFAPETFRPAREASEVSDVEEASEASDTEISDGENAGGAPMGMEAALALMATPEYIAARARIEMNEGSDSLEETDLGTQRILSEVLESLRARTSATGPVSPFTPFTGASHRL